MLNSTQVKEAVAYIQSKTNIIPEIGAILGSGLGFLADGLENAVVIPYEEIPHFPHSTIAGHEGSLVIGEFEGKKSVFMKGRVHYYEGYDMSEVVFPLRVMYALGARTFVITNAAGAIHPDFKVGDMMVIEDHINLLGNHPLRGPNDENFGPRFPDMSYSYDRALQKHWHEEAQKQGITLRSGVYAAMLGPSYETPAEIRMLSRIGADAVGMSTVPEVIAARHLGARVTGLSVLTNLAAGISQHALSHEEVGQAGREVQKKLVPLLRAFIKNMI